MIKLIVALLTGLLCNFSEAEKEKVIPIKCASNTFACGDNSKCVQAEVLSDYNKDCDDFSDEQFSMCRIKGGLKPMEDIVVKDKEISTLREKLTTLQDKSKLEDIFGHLASSFNESSWSKNDSVCPPLYVNLGGKCMAFFSVAKVTWAEAKQFCESISGTLAILRKIKDYESLLKHLKSQDLTTDFWIGGHYYTNSKSNTSAWIWLDEKDIFIVAPYWSLYQTQSCTKRGTFSECYSYALAPRENRNGFCLSLDYAFHYYFIDQNCHEKRSPLCFYNEK